MRNITSSEKQDLNWKDKHTIVERDQILFLNRRPSPWAQKVILNYSELYQAAIGFGTESRSITKHVVTWQSYPHCVAVGSGFNQKKQPNMLRCSIALCKVNNP